eukprot:jgi/Mesvir1/20159/Mv13398-RA.1
MGAFWNDFKQLALVGLVVGIAHATATTVRQKREKFRLKTAIGFTVLINWALVLMGLFYVYKHYKLGSYAYETDTWTKIAKGVFTASGAAPPYLAIMSLVYANLSGRSFGSVMTTAVTNSFYPIIVGPNSITIYEPPIRTW